MSTRQVKKCDNCKNETAADYPGLLSIVCTSKSKIDIEIAFNLCKVCMFRALQNSLDERSPNTNNSWLRKFAYATLATNDID